MSIEKWFVSSVQSPPLPEKRVLYLEWLSTTRPNRLEWLTTPPPGCNVECTVKLRGAFEVTVAGKLTGKPNEDPFRDLSNLTKKGDYREYANVSFLKSHLQKAVRLKQEGLAIRTAFHLMRLNFLEFCRRFVIIAVEDACVHRDLTILVWFMMLGTTSTRYLDVTKVRYLLGIVRVVTLSSERDWLGTHPVPPSFKVAEMWEAIGTTLADREALQTVIWACIVRRCYGGMRGDLDMFTIICQQALEGHKFHFLEDRVIPARILTYLAPKDCLLSAYDFHVVPSLPKRVCEEYPDLTEATVKRVIWVCSSCINPRTPHPEANYPNHIEVWKKIQDYVHKKARWYILHAS